MLEVPFVVEASKLRTLIAEVAADWDFLVESFLEETELMPTKAVGEAPLHHIHTNVNSPPDTVVSTHLEMLVEALEREPAAPLDEIHSIVNSNPKVVMAKDFFGSIPLHIACWNKASPEVNSAFDSGI